MVLIIRVLFAVVALFLFWFGSICLGERIYCRHGDEPNGEHIMSIAHQLISVLLAIFFTLWCVKVGVV